ncbi:ABC transporter substrate-binding protein [Streptomyces sp. NPDC057137]|uniref:ABC transporter substrate-binding protein n=1 Tax=Streptomyces sp. NPDC057137 TaxID=3346030 RepID=UPI00363200CF
MNSPPPVPAGLPLTRRRLLSVTGALGLGALLTACGDSESGDNHEKTANAGKGWSFKDDRGRTATADSIPRKIVAYIGSAAALHDFGVEVTGVFGPTKLKNGEPDVQAGGVDVDKVTVIGNAWGEFNVEKYASLQPDLLITNMNVAPTLWYVPEESGKKIEALAPTVGILAAKTSLLTAIGRYAELAESLGADLKATKVTDAKARFEAASEALRKAAKAKPGLKVLAVAATQDLCYVAAPAAFADLRYYQELGVEFAEPAKPAADGFYEELSWENVGRYGADLLLVDKRTGNLQPADLAKDKPTWRSQPAVKAEQITSWHNEAHFSYAGYIPLLEALTQAVRAAKKVL